MSDQTNDELLKELNSIPEPEKKKKKKKKGKNQQKRDVNEDKLNDENEMNGVEESEAFSYEEISSNELKRCLYKENSCIEVYKTCDDYNNDEENEDKSDEDCTNIELADSSFFSSFGSSFLSSFTGSSFFSSSSFGWFLPFFFFFFFFSGSGIEFSSFNSSSFVWSDIS